jgi:hypothetical protein
VRTASRLEQTLLVFLAAVGRGALRCVPLGCAFPACLGLSKVGTIGLVGWLWIALLASAVAVLVAAEWPRLTTRFGWEGRRSRSRRRKKAQLKLLRTEDDPDEFAASVERDLAQLPTTSERDRDLS